MNDKRKCNVCGEDKLLSDFREGHHQCKKCVYAKNTAQKKKKREDDINNNKTQKCKECGVEKTFDKFDIGKSKCRECHNKKRCDDHKENVLDSVAARMSTRTPENKQPIEYYKNILTQLIKNQENNCFYSGVPLTVKQGCYNTISPERRDESIRGYNDIDNVRAICQLFQSASRPVNVEGSTIITPKMRKQILEEPEDFQRISNELVKTLTIGTVYKKVINFNINFNNEDEVKEEMKYLPNMMLYDKTNGIYRVRNKEGERINFGKKKHKTLQGHFKSAMKYWKSIYQNDYEIDENNKYIEYGVYGLYNDTYSKINICPETNFMTINPDDFQKHQIYNEFPDCSPGKAQWSVEKFNLVKELSTREDSQERKDRINKMINEARDIVKNYRNRDVEIENHTELTFLANRFANERSAPSQGRKKGEYKDLFLTYYDKVCEHRFRCEYTNIPMSLSACKNWQMSYDRYNNKGNYCGTNIAFVCNEFNTRFHWMPEHFKTFWDIDVPDYVKMKFIAIELNKYLIT